MVIYMRILVYGAGVLGCNLAHALWISHKDVTLLARGNWYEEIKNNGMMIRHKLFAGKKTNDRLPVINELKEQDYYDVVFVVMQCTEIIFMQINMRKSLPIKKFCLLFSVLEDRRRGNVIESFNKNNMTMGRIAGTDQSDDFIKNIFEGTKIKVTIENKMNDWLKSHVAFIMPFVALVKLGYEVLPESDYLMVSSRRIEAYLFIKLCCYTILGDLCVCDHARNGMHEMIYLNEQLKTLKRKSKMETKLSDELDQYFPTNES